MKILSRFNIFKFNISNLIFAMSGWIATNEKLDLIFMTKLELLKI